MKHRTARILIILVLLAVAARLLKRCENQPPDRHSQPTPEAPASRVPAPPPEPEPPRVDPSPATPAPRGEASRAPEKRDFQNPLVQSYPSDTPPPAKASNADPDVAADFDQIQLMLRNFRTLTGANPVGTNAEIMTAIMGDNPKGARLGPPDGQSLNPNGELIDRWGTPYFFHQLTKDLMEIHSAGPDRILWNEDDIISD